MRMKEGKKDFDVYETEKEECLEEGILFFSTGDLMP